MRSVDAPVPKASGWVSEANYEVAARPRAQPFATIGVYYDGEEIFNSEAMKRATLNASPAIFAWRAPEI